MSAAEVRESERILTDEPAETPKALSELDSTLQVSSDTELVIAWYDDHIVAMLEAKSIYMFVWACRRHRPLYMLAYFMTMMIQLAVPVFVVINNSSSFSRMGQCFSSPEMEANMDHAADFRWRMFEEKLSSFILGFYLCSTILGAAKRSFGMLLVSPWLPERSAAGIVGGLTILICNLILVCATGVLFFKDSDVTDLLLNCVAVNFLPDVDCALSDVIEFFDPVSMLHTQERLKNLQEMYGKCQERLTSIAYIQLTWTERFAQRPAIALVMALQELCAFLCILLPVLLAVVTGCGADE